MAKLLDPKFPYFHFKTTDAAGISGPFHFIGSAALLVNYVRVLINGVKNREKLSTCEVGQEAMVYYAI